MILLYIALAAFFNTIMDLILPLNVLSRFGYLWSLEAMEAPKKGWFNKLLPPDVWHRSKVLMIFCFGLAIAQAPSSLHYEPTFFSVLDIALGCAIWFGVCFSTFYFIGRKLFPNG